MKIGIYMAYAPLTVLGKEGLGRYIGNLIKGFLSAGHQVTIACPQWSLATIDDLFQDFQIDGGKVNFIVSRKASVLWQIYDKRMYKKRHEKNRLKVRVLQTAADILGCGVNFFVSLTSILMFALACLLVLIFGIALLPLALVAAALYLLARILIAAARKSEYSVKVALNHVASILRAYSSKKIDNIYVYMAERRDEVTGADLVKRVNAAEPVDIWFVPALFWPQIKNINGRKVVCAPDLVPMDFAEDFADFPTVSGATEKCKEVLRTEKYFITYCEHLRETLVIQEFGKAPDCVVAIPHINNAMDEWITIDPSLAKRLNARKDFTKAFARLMLYAINGRCHSVDGRYLDGFRFDDVHYVFYASQVRPHKNMVTLVKAYEHLLRRRYMNVKLILTGNIAASADLTNYIRRNRLEYDVLSVPDVTAQELAALYCCADLVINPTLYEGGFPFTFGEGMSVGTPSVMSDIPQTRSITDKYGLSDTMLFNPYDWESMAKCIEFGLKNREWLYQLELPMYNDLEKRTGEIVAQEYIQAFEHFIKMDRIEK